MEVFMTKDEMLLRACANGLLKDAELAIENGADVNAIVDNLLPLVAAVYNGHKGIVELLIARGADVNARTPNGLTIMQIAAGRTLSIDASPDYEDIYAILETKGAR
jgi:ankyrin repeat protein